ncbi:MAG: DUF2804 domain-containing protein [Treponema sp.]|nr:DUF2804 domain-containing protein [Treponema sp.]
MAQNEFVSQAPILDETEKPGRFGWARKPLITYNPPLSGGPSRAWYTESDRYIIFSATHLVVFEVIDSGFLGRIGVSVVSLKDKRRSTQIFDNPFALGRFELPRSSEAGSIKIREKKATLDFAIMESGARIIKVDIPKFGHNRHLRGEVVLSRPGEAESIVTLSPWRREKNAYRCFRCSPWFIAEGVMQFGTAELYFTKDNAWGIFDWIRQVRPRQDIRYWAAACGTASGRLAGLNVGYGSADSSCGTENAFFLDGVVHKLDQVTFHIPPTDWLEEWKFTSNDKRLEMTFTPNQERAERKRILFHSWKRRQVCGSFSGRVVLDNGNNFAFWNMTGFAERVKTRN